jgi:predicted DNA-binding transcriptional regulator YafY
MQAPASCREVSVAEGRLDEMNRRTSIQRMTYMGMPQPMRTNSARNARPCDVDGLDEIVWWVLSYGPHATVLEPAEFREMVQWLAAETSELYPASLDPRERKQSVASAPLMNA